MRNPIYIPMTRPVDKIIAVVLLLMLMLSLMLFPVQGFSVCGKMKVHRCRRYNDISISNTCSSSKGLIIKMTEKNTAPSSETTQQQLMQQQKGRNHPIEKTDEEWKDILTPEQYYILRKDGTESPGASKLNEISLEKNGDNDKGTFCCAGCNNPLFIANTKFESGTGWPSFFAPVTSSAVDLETDYKLIVPRTECTCSQCGGHLGHVFEDGPEITGQRYCMNGAALKFSRDSECPDLASEVKQMSIDNPYIIDPARALPGALVNIFIGGIFFNAFLSSGKNTPIDYLTLLPATYYGFLTVKTISKMMI